MMRNKHITLYTMVLFLLLFLVSCDRTFLPSLVQADQMLFVDYKRGEKLLDSIYDMQSSMSELNKRYYQLLRLKADDKAYRPIKDKKEYIDSLVAYFQHKGYDDVLAEAYFYAGRVYYDRGETPESLHFYQKASEKVADDNYALQGDIYCQMANIYRFMNLKTEALNALRLALKADSLNNNMRNVLYDLRDIGEAYRNNNINQAEKYFKKGLYWANKTGDSFMQNTFHHELASIYKRKNKWKTALFHVDKYISHVKDYPDYSGMLVTALEVYTHFNDSLAIEKYRKELLANGNVLAKKYALEGLLFSKLDKESDVKNLNLFRSYVNCADSIIKDNRADEVKKVERMYKYELKEKENQYLRQKNIASYLLLALLGLIGVFMIVYFKMKVKNMRQIQKNLELKIDKYKNLQEKAMNKSDEECDLELRTIRNSEVYKIFMKEIEYNTFKIKDEQWTELNQLLNSVYVDFDKNLYSFLDVSLQEHRICMLIKIGINPVNIAKIMCLTKEAISASRRRMYSKAFKKKGTPSDWDKIIKSL